MFHILFCSALADVAVGKKVVHIPYRDSVLTKLLQSALGGNSRTVMVMDFLDSFVLLWESRTSFSNNWKLNMLDCHSKPSWHLLWGITLNPSLCWEVQYIKQVMFISSLRSSGISPANVLTLLYLFQGKAHSESCRRERESHRATG